MSTRSDLTRSALTRSALVPAIALAGCAAPSATPDFQTDVAPILAARCVRCHGDPPIGGVPTGFLLDGYPDRVTPAGTVVLGAGSYAADIARRAAARTMPPRFPLDDDQIDVLDRWAAAIPGPDQPAPRGAARPDNQAPAIALEPIAATAWRYDLHDPDGDLVVGTLRARRTPDGAATVIANLHSGRAEVAWAPSGVAPGTYQLTAELDDGGEATTVALGSVEVP